MAEDPYITVSMAKGVLMASSVWGGFLSNCIALAHEVMVRPGGAWPNASLVVGAVECAGLGWKAPTASFINAVTDYAQNGGRRNRVLGFHAWLHVPGAGLIDVALSSALGSAEGSPLGQQIAQYSHLSSADAALIGLVYHSILTVPAQTLSFYEHIKADMVAHPFG